MAIPAFLNSSWKYTRIAITDVADIITQFRADAVTNGNPAWTEPSGGRFKSPVDAYGRFMEIALTRISATVLSGCLYDQAGQSVWGADRRMNINATAGVKTDVHIATGQFHFSLDCNAGATYPESMWGAILDLSPESQGAHSLYVIGFATRDSGGTQSNAGFQWAYAMDNAASALLDRLLLWGGANTYIDAARNFLGSPMFAPLPCWIKNGANYLYAGRPYQMLAGPAQTPFCKLTVAIDTGVTAEFIAVHYATANQALFVRCA